VSPKSPSSVPAHGSTVGEELGESLGHELGNRLGIALGVLLGFALGVLLGFALVVLLGLAKRVRGGDGAAAGQQNRDDLSGSDDGHGGSGSIGPPQCVAGI